MSEQAVIDCLAFAQDGGVLEGSVAVRDFTRLCDALADGAGDLCYRIVGGKDGHGRPCLKLQVSGKLNLRCQRCMQPLAWHVEAECRMMLARHVAELEAWDREADGLADAMLADTQFDWRNWLEEEVLLALPVSPMHPPESCPAATSGQTEDRRRYPFAVLAALKRQN